MPEFIADFSELRKKTSACVVLFSGDLYSSYFLLWAKEHGIRTIAVQVNLDFEEPSPLVKECAIKLGAAFEVYDGTNIFVKHFIVPAIQSSALHPDCHTLFSSLAQPIIADALLDTARKQEIDCIVYPASLPKTTISFANTVSVVAPAMRVANPFIDDALSTEDYRRKLSEAGIAVGSGFDISEGNIWGRVVHNDVVAGVGRNSTAKRMELPTFETVTLGFENGVPVSLNGQTLRLQEIISRLNSIGERAGVGQFREIVNDSVCNGNNQSVQAPAAEIILTAHRILGQFSLTERERRATQTAGLEWAALVNNGLWYSPLREAVTALIVSINRLLRGQVSVVLDSGRVLLSELNLSHNFDLVGSADSITLQQQEHCCGLNHGNHIAITKLRASYWQPTRTVFSLRLEDLP